MLRSRLMDGASRHRRARTEEALPPGQSEQSLVVEDHESVALEPDEPVVGERSEQLVHALARRADHCRELALLDRDRDADRTIRLELSLVARKPEESRGQSTRDVEEMEFLDMGRDAPELGRHP